MVLQRTVALEEVNEEEGEEEGMIEEDRFQRFQAAAAEERFAQMIGQVALSAAAPPRELDSNRCQRDLVRRRREDNRAE